MRGWAWEGERSAKNVSYAPHPKAGRSEMVEKSRPRRDCASVEPGIVPPVEGGVLRLFNINGLERKPPGAGGRAAGAPCVKTAELATCLSRTGIGKQVLRNHEILRQSGCHFSQGRDRRIDLHVPTNPGFGRGIDDTSRIDKHRPRRRERNIPPIAPPWHWQGFGYYSG